MSICGKIDPKENLGWGVFSSKHSKRASRGRAPVNVFLEKKGKTEISVDRLDYAPGSVAVEIGDKAAKLRNASFYEWAVVLAETASSNREEQKRHAQELADSSVWRTRPEHN